MKKFPYIVFIAFCMIALQANAQSSAGVKADMNLSNFWVNESTHLKSKVKAGCSAGFFYKYMRNENRAMEADMMFHYHTSEIYHQDTDETADYRYLGIELPVYAIIQADTDKGLLYLGMGPFASFGLYSRYTSGIHSINPYQKERSTMRRWDFGAGFIAGYELECKLQFNFNFQLGFRNLVGDGFENADMISTLISLGVGYRFWGK